MEEDYEKILLDRALAAYEDGDGGYTPGENRKKKDNHFL